MFGRLGGLFRRRSGSDDQLFAGGLADATLQADVWASIAVMAGAFGEPCDDSQIASIEVVGELGTNADGEWDGGPWAERWTLNRCGTLVPFMVHFSPVAGMRTDISIRPDFEDDIGH